MSMMATEKIYTQAAVIRHNFLRDEYCCGDIPLEYTEDGEPNMGLFNKTVRKRVKEKVDETRRTAMNLETSLSIYRELKNKGETAYGLYDVGRGKALARAGMLQTRYHRGRCQHEFP